MRSRFSRLALAAVFMSALACKEEGKQPAAPVPAAPPVAMPAPAPVAPAPVAPAPAAPDSPGQKIKNDLLKGLSEVAAQAIGAATEAMREGKSGKDIIGAGLKAAVESGVEKIAGGVKKAADNNPTAGVVVDMVKGQVERVGKQLVDKLLEGKPAMGAAATAPPPGFADLFPQPQGARIKMVTPTGAGFVVMLGIPGGSSAEVAELFRSGLGAKGWKIINSTEVAGTRTFVINQGAATGTVNVGAAAVMGDLPVTVTWTGKP